MQQAPGVLLVLNAGSSSMKFALFSLDERALEQRVTETLEGGPHDEAALERFVVRTGKALGDESLVAIGHRVVHGGREHVAPAHIDDALLASLERLVPLARLHQPHALALIRRMRVAHPKVPQVACFDTAFHATNGQTARRFGLPRALEAEGILRYGFHGLSYEYVAGELARVSSPAATRRTIVAHLGSGASLCALVDGHSVATTMSFSVLDGLVMGTRCGTLDPEVVLYLQRERGMSLDAVERLLYEESGLLGVSGISSDMRALLDAGTPEAAEAVALFIYRIVREAGSLAAAAGGLDTFVFTAGIGERAATIRKSVCAGLAWLGITLDDAANEAASAAGARCISASQSRVAVWVIPTDEEFSIARHTAHAVAAVPAESS